MNNDIHDPLFWLIWLTVPTINMTYNDLLTYIWYIWMERKIELITKNGNNHNIRSYNAVVISSPFHLNLKNLLSIDKNKESTKKKTKEFEGKFSLLMLMNKHVEWLFLLIAMFFTATYRMRGGSSRSSHLLFWLRSPSTRLLTTQLLDNILENLVSFFVNFHSIHRWIADWRLYSWSTSHKHTNSTRFLFMFRI